MSDRGFILAIIAVMTMVMACDKGDPPGITPDLVTEILAFDLGNAGDASDIRVDFTVENNLNVVEYRIMVIPAGQIGLFEASEAEAVPQVHYVDIIPEDLLETEYSISRLPQGLTDIHAQTISNDNDYVVVVFVVGTGQVQLSKPTRTLSLREQGIYDGIYMGNYQSDPEGSVFVDSIRFVSSQDTYAGQLYRRCPRGDICEPGEFVLVGDVSFDVVQESIESFTYNQSRCLYILCNAPDGICPGVFTGEGEIVDEIAISINHSGTDCSFSFDGGTLTYRRQ